MSITPAEKLDTIKAYGISDGDTGSAQVQCAVLTSRIKTLTEHLKANKKDVSCRRGLQIMVARRAKLLKYLARTDRNAYQELIKKLGLRR